MFGRLKDSLFENLSNCILGPTIMMGDVISYPRCCKCSGVSTGRICYAGVEDKVVDNPFCGKCFGEIFTETKKLIKIVHKGHVTEDQVLIQHYFPNQLMPHFPKTISELLQYGTRVSHE